MCVSRMVINYWPDLSENLLFKVLLNGRGPGPYGAPNRHVLEYHLSTLRFLRFGRTGLTPV